MLTIPTQSELIPINPRTMVAIAKYCRGYSLDLHVYPLLVLSYLSCHDPPRSPPDVCTNISPPSNPAPMSFVYFYSQLSCFSLCTTWLFGWKDITLEHWDGVRIDMLLLPTMWHSLIIFLWVTQSTVQVAEGMTSSKQSSRRELLLHKRPLI